MTAAIPVLKVLHIEDNPVDAIYVKEILAEAGARWELRHVRRLAEGLRLLSEQAYDGLLLDLDLIDSRGLETLDTVRRIFPAIPIVVLSGFLDETFGFRSLEKGTQDYLVKGRIDGGMLIRSMRYAIERKRTENALQESEARLKSLFRDAAIGMAMVSMEGEFLQVNPALCEYLGFSEKELVGKTVRDVTYVEDWQLTARKMEGLKAGESIDRFEKRYRHRNGSLLWAETRAVMVRDGEGRPSHFVSQLVDITARKTAELALRRSEARFRTLTERSTDLILIVDSRGGVQYKSLNVEHVLGFPEKVGAGENVAELVHPDDRAELDLLFMEGVEQPGAIRKGEVRLRHRSGAWRTMEAVARNLVGDPAIHGVVLNLRDITERKEAEAALKESEARFRFLVQRAPEAILVHDVDEDCFIDANFNAERLFGCQAGELLRVGPRHFYVSEQPDKQPIEESMRDHVARALDGQEVVFDRRIRSADGRDLYCEVRLARLPARGRKLLRASFIDITARKKGEDALRESEERYRSLFESSRDGIAFTDLSGRILKANPAYSAMLGYTPVETTAMTYQSVTPGAWRARDMVIMRDEVLVRGYCDEYEKEYTRKDGSVFPVTVRAWLIRDTGGQPVGTWRIIRDITERKRLEAALRRRERELKTLADNVPDIIGRVDRELRHTFVNNAISRLTGQPLEAHLGKTCQELPMPPGFCEAWTRTLREVLASGVPGELEFTAGEKPAEASYSLRAVPEKGPDGRVESVVFIARDVTTLARAQDDYRRAKEAAERYAEELARSNRDLEEFARVVSHDLQEPLRMVTGFLQLVQTQSQDKLDTRTNEFIDFAVDGAGRMKTLITSLLDYSRSGGRPLAVETASLESFLETALANLDPRIRKTQAVITHDPLPEVTADPEQITQLLQNLLCNALKFIRGEPRIHVGAARRDGEWVVSVRDNGIGIEPKQRERIFEVFQKIHDREDYEGTGIGLAICKKIVQRHGGRIWVESEPGKGSVFYFSLPDAGPSREQGSEAGREERHAAAGRAG
jgi:PAS domain S-box-containing protein